MSTDNPVAPVAASVAAVKKPAKQREEVFSKDDLVVAFQKHLETTAGIKVSKARAWVIYKLTFATSYALAAIKPLSLSGIGRFSTLESKRSVQANKPAARMRFRTSARTTEILNGDKNFFADIEKEVAAEPADAATAVPATPDASAPVAAAVAPAATGTVAPGEPLI